MRNHTTARSLLVAAAISGLLMGCDAATSLTGRDPLVEPSAVTAAALQNLDDTQLAAFYEARDYRPAWTGRDAATLERLLGDAQRHGIDPESYTSMITAEDPVGREIQLTRAALDYADVLAHGLADPEEIFGIFALERNEVDLVAGLDTAIESGSLTAWIQSLAPQDAEYERLSEAYLRFLKRAEEEDFEPVEIEGAIHEGESDPRVPAIAQRLRAEGFLMGNGALLEDEGEADSSELVFTEMMSDALGAFQREQGIEVDGVVGPETLRVLNAGPADRALQIALNLEARRWLAREPSPDRLDVNLPAAKLSWYHGGEIAEYRTVIVGSPDNKTPHLGNPFSQLVVNPPWTVPQGIAEEEILPNGPGYMQARNMYVNEDGWVVQRPGPDAALGVVKFDMQNQYAIYLHDTPAKDAFDQNVRYLSHGCVRVEDAPAFGQMIADAYGAGDEYRNRLASGQTDTVKLNQDVDVRLLYHTAFVDEDGQLAFRPDMYGWDARLAEALGVPAPMQRDSSSSAELTLGP